MKRICGWCHRWLGDAASEEELVTHSICEACSAWFRRNVSGRTLQEFLEELPAPVLVVDRDVAVLAANRAAQHRLGMQASELEGRLGGQVIECSHARLPGGCGQTVHCRSCAIRQTVNRTFLTGEPQEQVPAYQDIDTTDEPRTIRFIISTRLVEGVVLLRLDEIGP